MVTPGSNFLNAAVATVYGLSTDTKPLNCVNGTCFVEMDTSSMYFFDEENHKWWKWGS